MAISTEIVDNEDFRTLFGSIQLSIRALRGETLGQTLVSMEKGRGRPEFPGEKARQNSTENELSTERH